MFKTIINHPLMQPILKWIAFINVWVYALLIGMEAFHYMHTPLYAVTNDLCNIVFLALVLLVSAQGALLWVKDHKNYSPRKRFLQDLFLIALTVFTSSILYFDSQIETKILFFSATFFAKSWLDIIIYIALIYSINRQLIGFVHYAKKQPSLEEIKTDINQHALEFFFKSFAAVSFIAGYVALFGHHRLAKSLFKYTKHIFVATACSFLFLILLSFLYYAHQNFSKKR